MKEYYFKIYKKVIYVIQVYINLLYPSNYVIANNLKITAFHVRVSHSLYDFLGK